MIARRGSWWLRLLLLALGSFIVAVNLSHWLLPERSDLTVMRWPVHWIEPPVPAARAYYRYTIDVPFQPQWAWVALATEGYMLYINGKKVSENLYIANSTLVLQHQTSEAAQGLNPFAPDVVYKPELRRSVNDEWRFPLHVQIAPYLHPGRNVFALFEQSLVHSRFAIQGRIEGQGQSLDISPNASDWRVSPLSKSIHGLSWYSRGAVAVDWARAKVGASLDTPLYASAPPAIWETAMPGMALTGVRGGGDLRLRLAVPGRRLGSREESWVRVYSNWPYYLFLDDQLVGIGGGLGGAEAWDLASFRHFGVQHLNLRLAPQVGPMLTLQQTTAMPLVVIDGMIGGQRITPASGWQRVDDAGVDWLAGKAKWSPALLTPQVTPPGGVAFQLPAELGAFWYAEFAILWLAAALCLLPVYGGLRLIGRRFGRDGAAAAGGARWVLSLAAAGLIFIELLRLRLIETDAFLLFIGPENRGFVQLLCPILLIAALAAYYTVPRGTAVLARQELKRNFPALCLLAIIALAVVLRVHAIGFEDLQDDENVSWDAARGVMHTGLPLETSGIYYTRSSLYHYELAGWLLLFGDSKAAARLFSVIPGVIAVWFTYRLTLRASGGRKAPALIAALVLAIDPWQLRNSQDIRFYQQEQTFSVIAMECFFAGFLERRGKLYQNLFFLSVGAAVLSQEVFVLTFPGYCIAALYFYRPWRWRENLNVCVGFAAAMGIVLYDVAMFEVMTLTANNGISSSNLPAVMLHLWNVTILPASFFLGYLQDRLVFSAAFLAGVVYWARRSNQYVGTMYIQLVCGVITGTILVIQIEHRYVYQFYPFLIVVAAVTIDAMLRDAAVAVSAHAGPWAEQLRRRWLVCTTVLCMVSLLFAMDTNKVLLSYQRPINEQQESAFWFIVAHRHPGDLVISNTPDVAATVTHGLDYFLFNTVFFDALYQRGNHIVDRWAGGKVISNMDMFRRVLVTHDRVWIVLADDKIAHYLPSWNAMLGSGEVKYEWFGGRVLLWERDKGTLKPWSDSGGADNSY